MINIQKHIINRTATLKTALEKLNKVPENLTLFVLDNKKRLVGTLTDGDVRRGIINGFDTKSPIEVFMTTKYHFLKEDHYPIHEIQRLKKLGIKLLPILNSRNEISGIVDFNRVKTILPVEAIIMAGGRGERLRPLTDKTPKPLLKIGDKPIIEHIIDQLINYGISNFVITLQYLGNKIEEHFEKGLSEKASIRFVYEDHPLGTIGAIRLINEYRFKDLLIINGDVLSNINYEDFYLSFIKEQADICIATVPYNIDVPYAVLETQHNNTVTGLTEKPRYTMHANAGIYLIKSELAGLISDSEKTDATDFIKTMIESGYKVIKYPILGYWVDIGKPEDYSKAKDFFRHLINDVI